MSCDVTSQTGRNKTTNRTVKRPANAELCGILSVNYW